MKRKLAFAALLVMLLVTVGVVFASGLDLDGQIETATRTAVTGKPYTVVITVQNVGDTQAWDTYVEWLWPANVTVNSYNPQPRFIYSNRASWYLYRFNPGQVATFTVTLTPNARGTNHHMLDLWYRAENAPGVWVNEQAYIDVKVVGRP